MSLLVTCARYRTHRGYCNFQVIENPISRVFLQIHLQKYVTRIHHHLAGILSMMQADQYVQWRTQISRIKNSLIILHVTCTSYRPPSMAHIHRHVCHRDLRFQKMMSMTIWESLRVSSLIDHLHLGLLHLNRSRHHIMKTLNTFHHFRPTITQYSLLYLTRALKMKTIRWTGACIQTIWTTCIIAMCSSEK